MGAWSQSHFLQALGWATLNSFWQMAILWCAFVAVQHLFNLSATKKYQASVGAMLFGFGWFITTFILYYQNNESNYAFFENTITHSNSLLHICLLSASVTYLLLLVFPAVRLFKNWQFVQVIKKEGLSKADLSYRIFVEKISFHLGIGKKVKLVVSHLVSSPVTVGYLKPMILLPVAALNQLTPAQVEAILLHELSHIRRYDYLVNLIVSMIHTLLYFNPFVKFFMNTIENERETCCDELVLQFGYDKVGYASALLHLEKVSGKHKQTLALAASGKQNLLTRIEKIVGMEKKKTFRLIQIVPLLASMICVLLFNSVLIIKDAKNGAGISYTNDAAFMPWQLNNNLIHSKSESPAILQPSAPGATDRMLAAAPAESNIQIEILNYPAQNPARNEQADSSPLEHILPVSFDEQDSHLTAEEKNTVKTTLQATKKVMSEFAWKEIENSMAEVMNKREKSIVKQEYLQEFEAYNWKRVEQNLKTQYDNLNWKAINDNINQALVQVQMDSLQKVYVTAISQLDKLQKEVKLKASVKASPLPDCSIQELNIAREALRMSLDSLKAAQRSKKVIEL